jgi:hypothetical protein
MAGLGVRLFTGEMISPDLAVELRRRNYDALSCHEVGRANQAIPILTSSNMLPPIAKPSSRSTSGTSSPWTSSGKPRSGRMQGLSSRRVSPISGTSCSASRDTSTHICPTCRTTYCCGSIPRRCSKCRDRGVRRSVVQEAGLSAAARRRGSLRRRYGRGLGGRGPMAHGPTMGERTLLVVPL